MVFYIKKEPFGPDFSILITFFINLITFSPLYSNLRTSAQYLIQDYSETGTISFQTDYDAFSLVFCNHNGGPNFAMYAIKHTNVKTISSYGNTFSAVSEDISSFEITSNTRYYSICIFTTSKSIVAS